MAKRVSGKKEAELSGLVRDIHPGRRYSYVVARSGRKLRHGSTIVSGDFFPNVLKGCQESAGVSRGKAVDIAARLLGISRMSFYRGLKESTDPLVPNAGDKDLVRGIRAKSAVDQWKAADYDVSKRPSPADLLRAEKDKKGNTLDERLRAAQEDWLKKRDAATQNG